MTGTTNELWQGYAPEVKVTPGNPEAQKYGRMWEHPEYRVMAPGEFFATMFQMIAKPARGSRVIDFGCGTGRGGAKLAQAGLDVAMIDFVRNCLDQEVKQIVEEGSWQFLPGGALHFIKADLEKPIPVQAEYGFCTDVMEHIPPDKVGTVLDNILKAAQHVWFSIAMFEDACGGIIGETLHLSVHPFEWWKAQFEARDCVFHWSKDDEGKYAHFYVTAWQTGQAIVEHGVLNTEQEQIRTNVRYNCSKVWTPCQPHESNDFECMILGGGPSMASFEEEIKKNRAEGVKLLTLNGAYNWAVRHGITPSAQIVVDARAFNSRFVDPVVDGCKYLISSQCDPSVFENLPRDRTFMWHTSAEMIEDILKEYYPIQYFVIPGGSTVLLRAIPLMRMLGYRKFILYGCDSCLQEHESPEYRAENEEYRKGKLAGQPVHDLKYVHHAYDQKENDGELVLPVIVNPGGRLFHCNTWMISQANEFLDLIKYLGDEIELDVRGDGLLSHILQVGAAQAEIQEIKLD